MKIEICPVCGNPIEYIELTTFPPVPVKQCPACGWRWEGKPEKIEYVPVEEKATIGWRKPSGFSTSAYQVCSKNLTEQKEVFELAITALRSMPEAGEPLTVEQLREMGGKPVWCEWLLEEDRKGEIGAWFIVVKSRNKYGFELKKPLDFGCGVCKNENYGTGWLAYPYPPAHIDRSKWITGWKDFRGKPQCPVCKSVFPEEYSQWGFCPKCGQPLTEEAWAELERRLRMPEPPEEG